MTHRRYIGLGLFALFGALMLAACSQETPTPKPPPQPVSVIIVTATFTPTPTPTPTITSTPTALPREKIEPVEGMAGWNWVYGRTTRYVVAQTDFDYRARYLDSEWDLWPGPMLVHRVLPECTFNIFEWGMDGAPGMTWPPPGRRTLDVPSNMESLMSRDSVAPYAQYGGDENDTDFESQADNCQAAGQRVLDTLMLAPPSPGFVPTPTALPQIITRPDYRDPAWSVYSYTLDWYVWQPRLEFYYRTEEWTFNPYSFELDNNAIAGCSVNFERDNYAGSGSLLTPDPPLLDKVGSYVALASHFTLRNEDDAIACKQAAQQLANTLYSINPLMPNP